MADLKDTIKALEICREMDNPPGWRTATCEDCPYKGDGCARKLKEDAAELLKSQPQIVRCKDCKHRPAEPEGGADHGSDYIFPDSVCPCQCDGDPWYSWMPPDNWFCPKGERKEGDSDADGTTPISE